MLFATHSVAVPVQMAAVSGLAGVDRGSSGCAGCGTVAVVGGCSRRSWRRHGNLPGLFICYPLGFRGGSCSCGLLVCNPLSLCGGGLLCGNPLRLLFGFGCSAGGFRFRFCRCTFSLEPVDAVCIHPNQLAIFIFRARQGQRGDRGPC